MKDDLRKQICLWSDVFTKYDKVQNEIFVILYWYLFNKPDYAKRIADTLRDLRKLKEFAEIPKSVTDDRNIGGYLTEMEGYNLISRIGIKNRKLFGITDTHQRRVYYLALSFFYRDSLCIKTPESVGKDIETHFKEHEKYRRILGRNPSVFRPYHTDSMKKYFIIPAQRIVQDHASEPEKFMKKLYPGKQDHMLLYDLIAESFQDAENIIRIANNCPDGKAALLPFYLFDILDRKKISQTLKDPKTLILKYGNFRDKPLWEKCRRLGWDVEHSKKWVKEHSELYRKLGRGRNKFNKETLKFEIDVDVEKIKAHSESLEKMLSSTKKRYNKNNH